MGLLGLNTLLYFVENHSHYSSTIIRGNRNYPFASIAINIAQLLCNLLNINEG